MLTSFFMGLLKVLAITAVTYTAKELLGFNENSDSDKKSDSGSKD